MLSTLFGGLLAQRDSMFMNSRTGPSPQLVRAAILPYWTPLPTPQTDTCWIFLVNSNGQERDPICMGCLHAPGQPCALAARSHLDAVSQMATMAALSAAQHRSHFPMGTCPWESCSAGYLETPLGNKPFPLLKLPVSHSVGGRRTCMNGTNSRKCCFFSCIQSPSVRALQVRLSSSVSFITAFPTLKPAVKIPQPCPALKTRMESVTYDYLLYMEH